MIRDSYDVVVVGGGPAGTVAARFAAEGGASVLLLEKDRDLGIPVRCAEGVGRGGLRGILEPDPKWIAAQLNGVRFIAPDGTILDINTDEVGYILNRRLFDQELGRKAAQAGAQIMTRAYVNGLIKNSETVKGVSVKFPDSTREVKARIVIGADGTESRVGRWAGLSTHFALKDLASCYQMVLGGIKVNPDVVSCYFGSEIAPGGYAWVFPKSADTANVGLGITCTMSNGTDARTLLNRFVDRNFPKASVLACVSGGVPAAKPVKKIHGNGVMLVGDAVSHANPLTGGGISNAMAAGRMAGSVAATCIKKGSCTDHDLAEYSEMWEKRFGDEQRRLYRLKGIVHQISDDTLNNAAQMLLKIPPEKRTLQKVFTTTLSKHPKLILDLIRILFRS